MTTTATTTAPALTVAKDGQDFTIVNEAGEVLARAATRREAREMKAEIEAEIEAGVDSTEAPAAEEVAEVLTEAEAIVADAEEEWVPAEDDTTESGEAPAAEAPAAVATKVEAPKKAKKVACPGSSTYVGYQEYEVTEHTKKGRAAWVEVACDHCTEVIRAGVWFTEKGIPLNGNVGMAYLPKH